jgi:two-component system nitrogen regulation response regulator NtrX
MAAAAATAGSTGGGMTAIPAATTLKEFKDVSERLFLVQKLRENDWNISRTADVIDTPRSNLYKKLEQYTISQETDG